MKKILLALFCLIGSKVAFADVGDVTVINTISPQNNAFQYIVRSTNVFVSTTPFSKNLGPTDVNLQHALNTIDQLTVGGGGGGSSSLAVGTGTASNFTTNVTSPTAVISFLGSQFNSTSNGTTNFISLTNPGGGGTPAAPNQSLQYNNSGSFGGVVNSTFDATSNTLTLGTTTNFVNVASVTFAFNQMVFSSGTQLNMAVGSSITLSGVSSQCLQTDSNGNVIGSGGACGGGGGGGGGATVNVSPHSVLFSTGGTTISGNTGFQYDDAVSSITLSGNLGIAGTDFRFGLYGRLNTDSTHTRFYTGVSGAPQVWMFVTDNGGPLINPGSPLVTYLQNGTMIALPDDNGATSYIYGKGGTFRWAPQSGADQYFQLDDWNNTANKMHMLWTVNGSTGDINWDGSTFTVVNKINFSSNVLVNNGNALGITSGAQRARFREAGILSLQNVNTDSADSTGVFMAAASTGTAPAFLTARRSSGTTTSPTFTAAGQNILQVSAGGYGTTNWAASSTGRMDFIAEQDFTDSSQPTAWQLSTTSSTVKVSVPRIYVAGNGSTDLLSSATFHSHLVVSELAAGQCVQTGAGGILTVTGSACGSGSGTSSSSGTAVFFNQYFGAAQAKLPGAGTPFISNSTGETSAGVYFDEASTQSVTWSIPMVNWSGGQLSADIIFNSTATSGTMNWGVYTDTEQPNIGQDNYDTPVFSAIITTSVVVDSVSNSLQKATVVLSNTVVPSSSSVVTFKLEREAGSSDTAVGFGKVKFLRVYESTGASGTGGSGGGGSGTVNSGTIGQNAYYAANGTTLSGSSNMITNTSSETFNVTTNHLFGFSSSTGVFSSSVTISDPGRLLLPDGSSLAPSLARSAAKTTGINLSGTGIASLIAGTQILLIGSNTSSLTNNFTAAYSPLDLTTNSEGVNYSITPNSNNNYYYRHVFTFQHSGGGSTDQFSTGMRDKLGEDPYWYIGPSDQVSATFGTDFVHINVSSFSSSSGFVGINKSTPIVNLDVNGTIAASTITAQSGLSSLVISTTLVVNSGSLLTSTIPLLSVATMTITGKIITSTDATHVSPVLSSCGTGPSMTLGSSDTAGTVTPGSAAGGCTLTFGTPFANKPSCIVTEQTDSLVNALSYTESTTALILTQTSMTSTFDWHCTGH